MLQGTAVLAATGLSGCVGSILGCDGIAVEGPDGETSCVAPVEGEGTIEDYYGYATEVDASSATPDELEVVDATVTFVYRNGETGDRHLVVIQDDPETDSGGSVPMTFRGVSGYEWTVLDDDTGNDTYETPESTLGETESVLWRWNPDRTDGGAIGTLGGGFDVEVVHQAEGSIAGNSVTRSGVDSWLFLDGDDLENPVELATFGDDGGGDVSVQLTG